GRASVTDSISAFAYTQWLFPTGNNGKEKTKTRAQYIGVDFSQYGIITAGRGDNAFYTVAGATDIFEELDMRVNDHYILGDHMPGLISWSLSTLGWDFRTSFQTASDNVNDTGVNIYNGFSLALATRTANGVSVAWGLGYYDFSYGKNADVSFFGPSVNIMHGRSENDLTFSYMFKPSWKIDKGIAVSYGTLGDGLYVAVNGTITKYDNYTNHLYSAEAVADYAFENGLSVAGGYGIKRFKGANVISEINLNTSYALGPTFKVFMEGSFDAGSKPERYFGSRYIRNNALKENRFLLGAKYSY
ncbi:MAG: hypothetical protein ACI4M9_06985, partial [Succinivibrio sp.]